MKSKQGATLRTEQWLSWKNVWWWKWGNITLFSKQIPRPSCKMRSDVMIAEMNEWKVFSEQKDKKIVIQFRRNYFYPVFPQYDALLAPFFRLCRLHRRNKRIFWWWQHLEGNKVVHGMTTSFEAPKMVVSNRILAGNLAAPKKRGKVIFVFEGG